jgi:hypothetical protein
LQLFVLCIEFSESLLAPRENHRFALPNLGSRTERCRFYTIMYVVHDIGLVSKPQ